jgi:hypothetical protein
MRPLHLIIQDLSRELTIELSSRAMGVSEGRAYKYGEDPEISGEPIPLTRLLRLIALAAGDSRARVQQLVDELLGHFTPANRKIIHTERIARLEEDLRALLSGGHAEFRPQETLLVCNDCQEPLQVIASRNGTVRYVCRGCMGHAQ